jgi:diguanylate cyclase (GGDEF)-like protein/PAS domain S-box-containing protein
MSAEDRASFQFLAENSTDVICRSAADGVLHYVSPSCFRVLGWKPEEMTGKRPDDFILSDDAAFIPDRLISGLEDSPLTVRMRRKDETVAWIEVKHRVMGDSAGDEARETIIVMRDVTERKSLEEQLLLLELTDSRTGLGTHRAFDEALEREWNRTQREGSQISLLLLDFDHFRQFHDWRQHREDDACLAKAAAAVIGALRITDFAAHYGAEDIGIILPSTDAGGAARVAAKVQSATQLLRSDPEEKGKGVRRLTVNIGVATIAARPGASARMPELLRLGADSALQKAKANRIAKRDAAVAAGGNWGANGKL